MDVDRLAAITTVRAPAKLNLFFEVLAKRVDGYHEIETLMVPISLYDTLSAEVDSSGDVSLDCRWASAGSSDSQARGDVPSDESNLAWRAADLLKRRTGVEQGIRIELIKRIPSAAGLGGGSSDAAAALVAANRVWNLNWSRAALAEVGAEIGSDVPFFLASAAAICRGRGERVEKAGGLAPLHFVVVRPPQGLATSEVYAHCQLTEQRQRLEPLMDGLRRGDLAAAGRAMFNRLEAPARSLSPWIARLHHEFLAEDCLACQMSGSGTSYFGLCHHALHARRIASRLQARGLGYVYAVSTSN